MGGRNSNQKYTSLGENDVENRVYVVGCFWIKGNKNLNGKKGGNLHPPKITFGTPKTGGLGRCFSFSIRGYCQVPAVSFQGV